MMRSKQPYIPQSVSEIYDYLGAMMLTAPIFRDKTGYFPENNIDTEFFALKEGLKAVQKNLGAERYAAAIVMVDRMRVHFEADPQDKTENGLAGRQLIYEMEDLLKEAVSRRAK